jgi:hypothetical protein
MKQGTQVAYVPGHAEGDLNHPDVEFGFVMDELPEQEAHRCRYWRQNVKHPATVDDLRTRANSESTPNECLVEYMSVNQEVVAWVINRLQAEQIVQIAWARLLARSGS